MVSFVRCAKTVHISRVLLHNAWSCFGKHVLAGDNLAQNSARSCHHATLQESVQMWLAKNVTPSPPLFTLVSNGGHLYFLRQSKRFLPPPSSNLLWSIHIRSQSYMARFGRKISNLPHRIVGVVAVSFAVPPNKSVYLVRVNNDTQPTASHPRCRA